MSAASSTPEPGPSAAPIPATRLEGPGGPPRYVFNHAPEGDELVRLREGLFWLRLPLPTALRHVNVYLGRDAQGWTIVDCGMSIPPTRAVWEQVLERHLDGLPVHTVICTHFHPDHSGLAGWLVDRTGARFLMPRTEYLLANLLGRFDEAWLNGAVKRFYTAAGAASDIVERVLGRERDFRKVADPLPPHFEALEDGGIVRFADRDWEILLTGGHSPAHASFWCAKDRIYLAGDQVLPRISPNVSVIPVEPTADPLAVFLGSLERLADKVEPGALALPMHGDPFEAFHDRVVTLARHHEERLGFVLGAVEDEPSVFEVMRRLFPRPLDDYQTGFAIGEALAHLTWLERAGHLVSGANETGVLRFARRS